MNYGPLDLLTTDGEPRSMPLGLIGTPETVEGVLDWVGRIRNGVAAKDSKRPNLFPRFPGFSGEGALKTDLAFEQSCFQEIPSRDFSRICAGERTTAGIEEAVDLFMERVRWVVEKRHVSSVVCAMPDDLVAYIDGDGNETSENRSSDVPQDLFHDLLKARVMALHTPTQLIRPGTYDESKRRPQRGRPDRIQNLQDEATRAWNFYVALYYKGGGIPWRLRRDSEDLTTCYIGVSYFLSRDTDEIHTATAQVFNERGEGVILRGGIAHKSKEDRQVHLTEEAAYQLLRDSLELYRREHKTAPARVVIHKTSRHNPAELAGFSSALRENRIENHDCLTVTKHSVRIFRPGIYPPLRGTLIDPGTGFQVLYTRGSVDFFQTYPGLFVPNPRVLYLDRVDSTPRQLAEEVLALTKMNWNNTQFDGGDPVTILAARKVGNVLKLQPTHEQPSYRFYM